MHLILFLIALLISIPCNAQLKEYEHLYDVDLNEELPLIWRLEREYRRKHSNYDWKYRYSWDMPTIFDTEFKQNIINFGTIEKRINDPDEEKILQTIKRMPKSMYPYIGPLLHQTKGLSGKILDLPGIKETKNKFPEKIAKRMQSIPDIEFASPAMYVYLSPLFWGEDMEKIEIPKPINVPPDTNKIRINPEFIKKVKEKVPVSDYALGNDKNEPNLGIRHYYADKNTPLSSADVKAFMATLDGLHKFKATNKNEIRMIMIDPIINYWDEKNGTNTHVAFLKGLVNPCQTIARKIKWTGLQSEFQDIIGEQSFGIDDWAYTCDKTIKAYRVANISNAYATTLRLLRKGYLYEMIDAYDYTPEEKQQYKYFIEATIQIFNTNNNDIEAVKPFIYTLRDKLFEFNSHYTGTPIVIP